MKTYRILMCLIFLLSLAIIVGVNVVVRNEKTRSDGMYRVEAKRIADAIEEGQDYDLADYPEITGVYSEEDGDLYESNSHYVIIRAGGKLYRVEYEPVKSNFLGIVNVSLVFMFVLIFVLLIYIYIKLIIPFGRINSVPSDLAKGNLAIDVPEEKSKFFGRFVWGINMLKDTMHNDKAKEISLLRDKNMLLLSLSHDIKTPLSSIKLNAKALERGLYKEPEKIASAASSINKHVDEIDAFLSDIIKTARDEFMEFDVKKGEYYLKDLVDKFSAAYKYTLEVKGIKYRVGDYRNQLLLCDFDRLLECLRNLMENALKYGDGHSIELSFEVMDGCELITLANTGCALKEEELTDIFDSFHRGSNAANMPGNGLGLYICKKLMNLMGGDIYAEILDGRFLMTVVVPLA